MHEELLFVFVSFHDYHYYQVLSFQYRQKTAHKILNSSSQMSTTERRLKVFWKNVNPHEFFTWPDFKNINISLQNFNKINTGENVHKFLSL